MDGLEKKSSEFAAFKQAFKASELVNRGVIAPQPPLTEFCFCVYWIVIKNEFGAKKHWQDGAPIPTGWEKVPVA